MSAHERLLGNFNDRVVLTGSPTGWAAEQDEPSDPDAQAAQVACFSEAPLERSWTLTKKVAGRRVEPEAYGVARPKYEAHGPRSQHALVRRYDAGDALAHQERA